MQALGAGVIFALMGMVTSQGVICNPDGSGSVHDFSAELLDGSGVVDFSDYAGKVMVIVNLASF